jgi:hypothetical protein
MSAKRSTLPYHRMYNGRDLGVTLKTLHGARLSMGDAHPSPAKWCALQGCSEGRPA